MMKLTRYLFVSIFASFLFFISACSEPHPLSPLMPDDVILAFGDSLTVGVGASQQYSYPVKLQELSKRTVISAGVSGEETTQGLLRLPDELERSQPDLVVLLLGGNDILRNRRSQKIKDNLANMIELIQSHEIEVVLVGVPEKKLFLDVAPLYQELADEYSLVFAEDILSDLLSNNDYKSDAVHLNQKGYSILAETIYELLVKHGAL